MNSNKKMTMRMICIAGVAISIMLGILLAKCNQKVTVEPALSDESEKLITMTVKVVAYCPCKICNEKWAGLVCTGKTMKELTDQGINICAVDPTVIPLGSTLIYDGKEYLATDVGGKIKGNIIDILLPTHKEANDFGVKRDQTIEVKMAK
jgi:3D (Asp-Asp-Asp) domain-containing protein